MSWLKRNLFFVIGSLVALILMGLAGWFLYSKYNLNNEVLANLNSDYEKLKTLNSAKPHPGSGSVNNIKLAQEQREQLREFLKKTQVFFQPVARIPDLPKITDRDFSAALSQTIEQLRNEATNSSVALPENYNFSFTSQKSKITFAPGSLNRLSIQLGEIRTIAEILFQAKINALDNIRRERVSQDDSFGLQTDYLTEKTETNALAVLTPYDVTFRSFSTELAAVLSGLAASPHALLVKTINIEPAPAVAAPEPTMPLVSSAPIMIQPQPNLMAEEMSRQQREADSQAAFAARYGLRGGNLGPGIAYRGLNSGVQQQTYIAPQPGQPGATTPKGGLPTVLDEKLLKITLNLYIIKPLPLK